ncbi:hypothetical protein TIFTF001_023860 [Ficus carica]|uniref:RNase H type-1 domain-containing protein n=1 Tax=Ficus carica TaxID=3494 RepID=A0AA88AV91_FICCA|nr:hypothetical protein TIFTF001_023860 [Ficus carica]
MQRSIRLGGGQLWSLKLPSKCCEGVESVWHSLWECPSAMEVQRGARIFLLAWLGLFGGMFGDFQQCFKLEVPVEEVGIGALIRDSEGMVVAGFARRVTSLFSSHIVEYIALWEGLSFAQDLGLQIEIV